MTVGVEWVCYSGGWVVLSLSKDVPKPQRVQQINVGGTAGNSLPSHLWDGSFVLITEP